MMRKSPANTSNSFPDRLREAAFSFQKSRILLSAYELDVFTALGAETISAQKAAARIGVDQRALERLMNALCAIGLLEKKKSKFSNTPETSRFLVKGSPDFMAGLMHYVHLWDSWDRLTETVRRGGPGTAFSINKENKEWLAAFIAAMDDISAKRAKNVVSLIDLSSVFRVLDVGTGSGAYAMAFAGVRKDIEVVAFDLPGVIPLTRSYIKAQALLDRVKTVSGDYAVNDLGRGFDLVFISAVVHSNSFDANKTLISKCAKALNAGGQLIVQDFIMDEDRTAPAFGAFFALNMITTTESGDTYAEGEVRAWFSHAGLSGVFRKETGFGTSLIIGKKGE